MSVSQNVKRARKVHSVNSTYPDEAIGNLVVQAKEVGSKEEVDQNYVDRCGCMRITQVLGADDFVSTLGHLSIDSMGDSDIAEGNAAREMDTSDVVTLLFVKELLLTRGKGLFETSLRSGVTRGVAGPKEIQFSKKCTEDLGFYGIGVKEGSLLRTPLNLQGFSKTVTIIKEFGRLVIRVDDTVAIVCEEEPDTPESDT